MCVGLCEWVSRCLFVNSLVSLCVCVPIFVCKCVCVCVCVCEAGWASLCASLSVCVSESVTLCVCLCLAVCLSVSLAVCQSVNLCVSVSMSLCVSECVSVCVLVCRYVSIWCMADDFMFREWFPSVPIAFCKINRDGPRRDAAPPSQGGGGWKIGLRHFSLFIKY